MVRQPNLGLEERGRCVGREGDLCGDAAVEFVGALAESTPLKPEAEVALAAMVAGAVGEFGAVTVGDGDGVAALGRYFKAPEKAIGGCLGGVYEFDLGLRVVE